MSQRALGTNRVINYDGQNHGLFSLPLEDEAQKVSICNLVAGRAYELRLIPTQSGAQNIYPVAEDVTFSAKRHLYTFCANQACHEITLISECNEIEDCESIELGILEQSASRNSAQMSTLVVDPNVSDQYLIEEVFIGSECFTVFNVTGIGNTLGRGTFSGASPDLDFDEGVLIASGNISVAVGPNDQGGANDNLPGSVSDPDLQALVTASVEDASGIEFDFIPTIDVISFDYIFASEEYEEYVCSQFNDVFGFFISGPNPNGGNYEAENIAIIPNTNLAVAINSVNPGVAGAFGNAANCTSLTNTQYYNRNNGNNLQFDGYTDVFTAFAEVVPCETYHIKLVVGDVGDELFDSGVFFGLNSFQAGGAVDASFVGGIPGGIRAQESCGEVPFLRVERLPGDDASEPLEITFDVSPFSTATADIDYEGISLGLNSLIIPVGVFFLEIPITILSDGIVEGTETIIIDIKNSCSCETNTVILEIIDEFMVSLEPRDATCGNNDGLIVATISNANLPISYTYTSTNGMTGSGNSNVITNLAAGTYDFIFTDALGCDATAQATVGTPEGPMISCLATDETAPNSSNGTVTATITGDTPPFSISWDGPSSGDTTNVMEGDIVIDSLAPGDYSITVTGTDGCSSTCNFSVAEYFCPLYAVPQVSDSIVCAGDSSGGIILAIFEGIPPYQISWSDSTIVGDEQSPVGLTAGLYAITVTDSIGCSFDTTILLTEPTPLMLNCSAVGETRPNADDGMATISIAGASPPYTLSWSGPSVGDTTNLDTGDYTINNLPPGDYTVVITDSNQCSNQCAFSIEEVPCTVSVSPVLSDTILCFGDCTAGIDLLIFNAEAPFNFVWTGPTPIGNEQNPRGLCAGTYHLEMTDANACQFDTFIVIAEPIPLQISCTATNETRPDTDDGTVTINIEGGTPLYSVTWNGPVAGSLNDLPSGDTTISDLPPGDYTINLTDANGCTNQCFFTVEPLICGPVVIPQVSSLINCFGNCEGSITLEVLNALPPYDFVWTGPTPIGNEQQPTGLCAGTYQVEFSDANGCQADTFITILEPSPITIACSAVSETAPNAADGVATINIGGGTPLYTLTWNGPDSGMVSDIAAGNFEINNLAPGNYEVVLTDMNGCSINCFFVVDAVPCTVFVAPEISSPIACFGNCDGAISLTIENAQPPFNFIWTGPTAIGDEQNPTGLCAGTYDVLMTDANNCQFSTSINLTSPTPLEINCTAFDETAPNANDGSAIININGATPLYSIVWSGPTSGSATNQNAGDFAIDNLFPGEYNIVVTDANGCIARCGFTIESVPCTAMATPSISTAIACFGQCTGAIELEIFNAQPPYTFNWTGPTPIGNEQNPSGLCTGGYSVVITDANQCQFTTSISIAAGADYPLAIIADPEEITCNLTSVVIDATSSTAGANISYQWFDALNNPIPGADDLVLTVDQGGTYTLSIIDTINGCATENTTTVTANLNVPIADAGMAAALTCQTSSLELDGSNSSSGSSISYRWTTTNGRIVSGANSTSPVINTSGQYVLLVTDLENGCSAQDVLAVEEIELESLVFSRSDPSCFGFSDGTIVVDSVVGGMPPYRYSLDGAFFSPLNQFTGLPSGAYSVVVQDALGCEIDLNTSLINPSPFSIYAGEDQVIPLGESTRLSAVTNLPLNSIANFAWGNPESLDCEDCFFPIASPLQTTSYEAVAVNIDGCVARDEVTIYVDRSLGVYIPSAFSPNSDGINDVFHVFARAGVERVNELRIFDRWGDQVFHSLDAVPNDPTYGWDGTHRGKPLNPAVFVYWAEVELINGDIKLYKGDVTLIR